MTFKATTSRAPPAYYVFSPQPIIDLLSISLPFYLSCFLQFPLWQSRPCWDVPHPCRVTLSRRQRTIVSIWCSGFVRALANHFTGECRTHTHTPIYTHAHTYKTFLIQLLAVTWQNAQHIHKHTRTRCWFQNLFELCVCVLHLAVT